MNKSSVTTIREVLNRLARVESKSNDAKEIVYDRELARIRDLARANLLESVVEAIGDDPKRKKHAAFVYSELTDVPDIEKVFSELLVSCDAEGRSAIIQTIRLHKMRSLVGVLNDHFSRESDDFCRSQLLLTLGALADESSMPIFRYLMQKADTRDEWAILCAAKNYASSDFQNYLSASFHSAESKTTKIMAAWGLSNLGDKQAFDYLVHMLDDPATTYKTGAAVTYDPGESVRAAQAISDINNWPFEWNLSSVESVKQRLSKSSKAN